MTQDELNIFLTAFRKTILDVGGSAAMANWVCADFAPRTAGLQISFDQPTVAVNEEALPAISSAMANIHTWVHGLINHFVLQMLLLELDLYHALHPIDPNGRKILDALKRQAANDADLIGKKAA